MQIHEFAILLLSLHQHVEESALAVVGDEAAEEYIWNGNTQGDADDGERSLIRLFIPTVTSPTTPCMSMKANRARYINTPGTIGITLGMVMHW